MRLIFRPSEDGNKIVIGKMSSGHIVEGGSSDFVIATALLFGSAYVTGWIWFFGGWAIINLLSYLWAAKRDPWNGYNFFW